MVLYEACGLLGVHTQWKLSPPAPLKSVLRKSTEIYTLTKREAEFRFPLVLECYFH